MPGRIGRFATLAAAALGCAAAAPAPAPAPIPTATFADRPTLTRPLLSPDGKRIAARGDADGKAQLLIFAADDPSRDRRLYPLGEATLNAMVWAGGNRVLLTVTTYTNVYGMKLPIQRLIELDLTTNKTILLDPKSRGFFGGEVIHVDPSGDWALVSSQDSAFGPPSVKRVDLATGGATTVERNRPDVWDWYADEAGVVRAGIAYQGNRWTIWYRERPEDPLKPIRSKSGKGEQGAVDGLRFVTGDNAGLVITNAKTGRFAAYRFDFRTGTIGEPYYQNDQVDISAVTVNNKGVVTGVTYEDDRERVAWLDPELKKVQAQIDKALPGFQNVVLNASADARRLLVWSGGAADPGTYYLFDRDARRLHALLSPFSQLSAVKLAPVTAVRYPARDRLSIPAYLTLPPGRPDKALPLIVMPHGGPFARDSWSYDPYVQFLASRGYAVLQPNFRGSTGYGKEYVERGYGQWGRAMQDDIDDGVDWLVKAGTVDPKRVCLMGASYGGYAALWGAIRNPDHYRCAISLAGVTDLPGMLSFDRRAFSAPRYFRAWQDKVKGTGESQVDLDAVSPLAQAARLTIPVLVAHGEKDDNVPARQSHQLVAALTKRGATVDSRFYPDEKHGLAKRENLIDFLDRVEAFLKKNNPA